MIHFWYASLLLLILSVFENGYAQTCSPTQCPVSYFDPDLTITPDEACYDDGESVNISCDGDLGGPPFNECNNGIWTFPSSTCEIFTCSKPAIGDAVIVSPDQEMYSSRYTITYTCNPGYALTGTTTATCDSQDTWNPATVPICRAICDEPNVGNGNISTSGPFYEGDSTQVECFSNSDLVDGSLSTITCLNNATWDHIPQCFGRCSFSGVANSNSEVIETKLHNKKKVITCDIGHSFNQQNIFNISCNNGTIEGLYPSECFADCVALAAPMNGNIIGGNLHGQVANFACDIGYTINDNATSTCINGKWNNTYNATIVCLAQYCTVPMPGDDNIHIAPLRNIYDNLDTVVYSCDDSFILNGNPSAECNDGTWNPPEYPNCEAYDDLIQQLNEFSENLYENSTEDEVVTAAETLELVTTDEDFVKDQPERIEIIADTLEAVANAGKPSLEVTDPVVSSVNNLMEFEDVVLQNSTSDTARIIAALERQISNLQESDENYTLILENVGVTTVQLNKATVGQNLNFANVFPVGETPKIENGLEEDNTQLYNEADDIPISRTATSISVPSSVINEINAPDDPEKVRVSFVIYGNAILFNPSRPYQPLNSNNSSSQPFREMISSQIISAQIQGKGLSSQRLTTVSNVIAKFRTNMTLSDPMEHIEFEECVFWSYDDKTAEGYWSNKGCERQQDEDGLIVCSCKRLASFAVLIRLRKDGALPPESLYWITLVGSIISIICLVICIASFLFVKKLRSTKSTIIHINLCVSLLGFYIAFLLSVRAFEEPVRCAVASAAIHYFCLATVTWMTVEAVTMYRLFVNWHRGAPNMTFVVSVSCMFGYGLPLIPVIAVSCLDRTILNGKADYCFLQPGPSLYFGFLAIVGVLFICNLVILIRMIHEVSCRPILVTQTLKNARRDEILRRLRHVIFFWFFLGLSWGSAFLTAIDYDLDIFEYLYCFAIALQGVMIFILLCVTNPEFRKLFVQCKQKNTTQSSENKLTTYMSGDISSTIVMGEVASK